MTFSFQLALETQVDEICSIDDLAQPGSHRRAFILRSVAANSCYFAWHPEQILGFAVLEYSFYEQGFVSLLVVRADWRRQGVGAALMRHLESICQTGKLFTSTNLSNLPMQALLARLAYKLSGVIHDLDEGDPELVYVKYLT
jgi:GNAT superfamily N-acetyltransferase